MMKKICCTILCICLLAALIGCGSTDAVEEATTTAAETEATTTAAEETTTEAEAEETTTEAEPEETTVEETTTEETTTAVTGHDYDVVVHSDEYVEIMLEATSADNIYFSITNVSSQILQVDCDYIQLDGIEYTYEYTEYASPTLIIAAGDTREYEYCVDGIIVIDNPEFSVFTGLFGIWDEEGYLLEFAGIPETTVGSGAVPIESNDEAEVLYSGENVEIAIESVQSDVIYFSITNVSDKTIWIDCDYIQLDGVEYTYEGSEYGSPMLYFVSGNTREYGYIGTASEDDIIFEIENTEYSEISGVFNVWDANTGELIERVSI